MSITFAELAKYAEEAGVFLAFSRPQFESYLLQHFEQSKETSRDALYEKIGSHMGSYGDGKYNKADLQWLERG
ncbi:hypothetical protein [Adlercreutzia sp. ZJ242]|uniref:hypothetical protein n=1 Tax=Adlercreutzia sp. ZJ242 TaxID=2709409 RepID=UPI0013EBF46B|nr:hypothetical protein [Adlercreutzia sp. ZJ242]